MDENEHRQRHKDFHKLLDEMVADYMQTREKQTGNMPLPSKTTLLDFMEWSHSQTIKEW